MTTQQHVEYDATNKAAANLKLLGSSTTALAAANTRVIATGGADMRGFSTSSVLDTVAAELSRQTRSLGERAEDTGKAVVKSVANLKGVDAKGANGFRKDHPDVDWELRW